ncbi:MAG: ComEC/Rec2 family competence protein, partial [Candidatus Rokuibacteriota bacterium]
PQIDVVCVSHVDDDHIVGIQRLLTELRRARRHQLPEPIGIRQLWHNSVAELIDTVAAGLSASVQEVMDQARADAVVAASYQQGRDVRDLAAALGLGGNPPFAGPVKRGRVTNLAGLEVTVIGPDDGALAKLAEKWRAAKERKDPSVITAAFTDRAVPNLSSVALHVRHGAHTALLTGDARGDHLLDGLEATGLVGANATLHVDVVKLPHHGSENNAAASFFERVHADHYVVSADGIKHAHPSESTLRWLVQSRLATDDYCVHLTNEIPSARVTLEQLQKGRRFTLEVRKANEAAAVIPFAG